MGKDYIKIILGASTELIEYGIFVMRICSNCIKRATLSPCEEIFSHNLVYYYDKRERCMLMYLLISSYYRHD